MTHNDYSSEKPPASDVQDWYVVRTKPKNEQRARLNLLRQRFNVFLPVEEKQQRRGKRQTITLKPLFPGYLFVSLDISQPGWSTIDNTFGVFHLLRGEDAKPQRVPHNVIATLIDRTDENGKLLPPEIIRAGDKMRIVQGPFSDWIAEVIDSSDERRIQLLFDLMGQAVRITTSRDNLAQS